MVGCFMADRLSLAEREDIALGLARGLSMRSIARRLGRAPSTVTREVANHSFHDHAVQFGRVEMRYKATNAHRSAATDRARPKRAKLSGRSRLRAVVLRQLRKRWSPQQIAGAKTNTGVEVVPLTLHIGAEIRGVELTRPLPPEQLHPVLLPDSNRGKAPHRT